MRHAQESDLTEEGAVHEYRIFYPSGHQFALRGVFGSVTSAEGVMPMIRVGEAIHILDPRGVICRDDLIISDPRRSRRTLPPWALRWLHEHPEWPCIVTEAAP
jgi:hypothetical protein